MKVKEAVSAYKSCSNPQSEHHSHHHGIIKPLYCQSLELQFMHLGFHVLPIRFESNYNLAFDHRTQSSVH